MCASYWNNIEYPKPYLISRSYSFLSIVSLPYNQPSYYYPYRSSVRGRIPSSWFWAFLTTILRCALLTMLQVAACVSIRVPIGRTLLSTVWTWRPQQKSFVICVLEWPEFSYFISLLYFSSTYCSYCRVEVGSGNASVSTRRSVKELYICVSCALL